MTDYKSMVLGKIGDVPLTLDDILFQLKTNLEQSVIDDAVHAIILKKVAEDLSITVTDEELQKAADDFRLEMDLISANETNEWLEEHGLTIEDFERKLENDCLSAKVQEKVATEDKINKLFAENILDFEKARISQIVVKDQGLAEEIKSQLDEQEADFATMAAKYSIDKDSASNGGYVGLVNRSDLPDEVDVVIFGTDSPALVGPIAADGYYYIINIIDPKKADPTEEITRATCIKLIFDDYITEKGQELKTSLDFLS